MQKQTSSLFRRARRTTAKKRWSRPKKHHRATTNSTKETNNLKEHVGKRLRLTRREQKRERQRYTSRRQAAWPDTRPEQQTIPRKRKNNKFQKEIASSQRQTLLGEVAAGKINRGEGTLGKGR